MKSEQALFVTSLSLGVPVQEVELIGAQEAAAEPGMRLVVLSADAPEWASSLLRPRAQRELPLCCG